MKKIVSLLLVLLLIAAMCGTVGCAKKPAETPTASKAPEAAPTAAQDPAPGGAPASLNTVSAGSLTVAISPDFAPMEFVDVSKSGQDQYVGFDVTLAKYIAEEMGLKLVIKPMSFDACQAAVQTGSVDMSISGYSWTPERNENFNLSDYYYAGENETEQTIITVKANEGKWTQAEDFAGLTVGAQTASLQMSLCTSQLPESTVIKEFSDIGTAVESLRNGNIDALAVAKGNGDAIIANNDALAFTGFEFVVSEEAENNVILLRKGSDDLTAKVNEILAKAYAGGLYGPWYEEAKELAGIPTSAEISYDDEGNAPADEPAEEAPVISTVSAGSLTVAISPDFAPMEFVDVTKNGQDQYVGFDVTLAKFIAEEMGLKLVIKPMSFDACQAAVQTGSVDMSISGYSWTPERNENFNLSDYYYAGENETEQTIITVKANEGKWTQAEDFAGLTVGAQTASLQMSLCTSQLPESTVIKEFSDIGTAVEALRNGNIDALAVAKGNGDAIIANNDALAFTGFEFVVSEEAENNVILLRKGSDALTAAVNEVLAKAYAEGYYGPWYEEAKALAGIPTSEEISYDDEGNAPG